MLLDACGHLFLLTSVVNALKKFGWQSRQDGSAGRAEVTICCKTYVSSDSQAQKTKENCLFITTIVFFLELPWKNKLKYISEEQVDQESSSECLERGDTNTKLQAQALGAEMFYPHK